MSLTAFVESSSPFSDEMHEKKGRRKGEEREPDPKNKTQFIYRYEDDFSFVNRAQR